MLRPVTIIAFPVLVEIAAKGNATCSIERWRCSTILCDYDNSSAHYRVGSSSLRLTFMQKNCPYFPLYIMTFFMAHFNQGNNPSTNMHAKVAVSGQEGSITVELRSLSHQRDGSSDRSSQGLHPWEQGRNGNDTSADLQKRFDNVLGRLSNQFGNDLGPITAIRWLHKQEFEKINDESHRNEYVKKLENYITALDSAVKSDQQASKASSSRDKGKELLGSETREQGQNDTGAGLQEEFKSLLDDYCYYIKGQLANSEQSQKNQEKIKSWYEQAFADKNENEQKEFVKAFKEHIETIVEYRARFEAFLDKCRTDLVDYDEKNRSAIIKLFEKDYQKQQGTDKRTEYVKRLEDHTDSY